MGKIFGRYAAPAKEDIEHLANKIEAVEALPDDDHVARFLLKGRLENTELVDEVIGEIVMGRSLLER